jgi:hypothetical protein
MNELREILLQNFQRAAFLRFLVLFTGKRWRPPAPPWRPGARQQRRPPR